MKYTDPTMIPMLTEATDDNTKSQVVALNNALQHYHEIRMEEGATAGVVEVRQVPTKDYDGEGELIFSMDATDTDVAAELLNGDSVRQISLPGPGGFVFHQITTAMADGEVASRMRRVLQN